MHAYRNEREPGQVELEASRPTGTLCVSVRDRGCGMAPRDDSPGAGLGLGLISTLATRVSIRPVAPRGTELVMRFDVGEHGERAGRVLNDHDPPERVVRDGDDPPERVGARRRVDHLDVDGAGALRALLGLIRDLRALGQGAEPVARDAGEVHEQVLAVVVRLDEAEALLVAEPLHGSCRHGMFLPVSCAAYRGRS